jgi:hypothetical protein
MDTIELQLQLHFKRKSFQKIYYFSRNGCKTSFYGNQKQNGLLYGIHYEAMINEFFYSYEDKLKGQLRIMLNESQTKMIPPKLQKAMKKVAMDGKDMDALRTFNYQIRYRHSFACLVFTSS